MSLNPETRIVVRVNTVGGILQPTTPLTIRNQLREYQINSIQDLPDVAETNIVNGATLVFNSSTNNYEIKPLQTNFIDGDIDGGEF